MALHLANYTPAEPLSSTLSPKDTFTIKTSAPTDIWRKPPSHDVFNAPIVYRSLPVSSFRRARVTATADWHTLYDQGGMVMVLPPKTTSSTKQKRWIKAGVEFYQGKPFMSVVTADEWADWSLVPLPEGADGMTVEFEREKEKDGSYGSVLRIWLLGNGERTVIREVTWAFWGQGSDEEELWVGAFAAKPTKDEGDNDLVVKFSGFEVETA